MWPILVLASNQISAWFSLDSTGSDVLLALTQCGAGGVILTTALFLPNAAFNALGKPLRLSQSNWLRDVLLTLIAEIWLTGLFGVVGVKLRRL